MRVLYARGDWRPGIRIEGLLRYAFIGDSFSYGTGVAPDRTFVDNAERQMNELLPAWPVEAVNFGVQGYNLWNSWYAFKAGPQVYDGIVLSLCNNDAELFGRSYRIPYTKSTEVRWKTTHPFGRAIVRCFDEMASFSRERSIRIAVIYFNAHAIPEQVQIGEIIGDLCAKRDFCFIDTLPHYRDRNFTLDDLAVGPGDFHPSVKAHEAIGRHLTVTLRKHGWFSDYRDPEIGAAPDRILNAARAMVEVDRYPPHAALDWALEALECKANLARRMEAAGAGDGFFAAAERPTAALTSASRRWHMANRLRAFVQSTAASGSGIAVGLLAGEEERLKLEEICVALTMGEWEQNSAYSLDTRPFPETAQKVPVFDVPGFFDACDKDLLRIRDALDGLRDLAESEAVEWPPAAASMLADIEILALLADRAKAECAALRATCLRLDRVFKDGRPALFGAHAAQVDRLIGAALARVKYGFRFGQQWLNALKTIPDKAHGAFTTVEVTMSCTAVEGSPIWTLTGQAEYSVPSRLPFRNGCGFRPDGSPTLTKLNFPLFYAGRVYLTLDTPKGMAFANVDITLIKVEVYTRGDQRLAIDPASFLKDKSGRFVSPPLYLF